MLTSAGNSGWPVRHFFYGDPVMNIPSTRTPHELEIAADLRAQGETNEPQRSLRGQRKQKSGAECQEPFQCSLRPQSGIWRRLCYASAVINRLQYAQDAPVDAHLLNRTNSAPQFGGDYRVGILSQSLKFFVGPRATLRMPVPLAAAPLLAHPF